MFIPLEKKSYEKYGEDGLKNERLGRGSTGRLS